MLKQLVLDQIFWHNDGVAALTTLAASSDVVLIPNAGGTTDLVTETDTTAHWMKIPLGGQVDELIVRYRSKLVEKGGITQFAGGNVCLIAVGDMYDDSDADFATPHEVSIAPLDIDAGAFSGNALGAVFWEGGTAQTGSAVSGPAMIASGGLFAETAGPANGTFWGWTATLTKRAVLAASGGAIGVPPAGLSVAGIQNVWLAINTFETITGTRLTTKLKGQVRILGYRNILTVRS